MYHVDESGSLVLTDQKFARDLYTSRRGHLHLYDSMTISITKGILTISGGTEEEYCAILTHALRCTPISVELFRNNMKKKPITIEQPYVIDPQSFPRPPSFLPQRNPNSQPGRRPHLASDIFAPEIPPPPPSRVEKRQPFASLVITKPAEPNQLEAPPPLPIPDLEFDSHKVESGFEVAAPPPDAPGVKVKLSLPTVPPPVPVPVPVEVPIATFRPEPLFDPAWRTTPPENNRLPIELPTETQPTITRRMIVASAPAERAEIAARYPFMKMPDFPKGDYSSSISSEVAKSYSSLRAPSSRMDARKDPRPEFRSLSSGRRTRPKWRRRGD
jgi:hypothetical protein